MKTKTNLCQTNRKIWAIVPAAGSGRRFSKTQLKQYQIIQDKTVLEHTIDRLNALPLAGYVLAIGEQDHYAQTLALKNKHLSHFCLGGNERVDSVLNALMYLEQFAQADDFVFVHDAARPCVTPECLVDLFNTAFHSNSNAILAIPVRDTLKFVDQQQKIVKTVSRDQLWQAQTPQVSTFSILKTAIEKALEDGVLITDEASALEHSNQIVKVVMGRSDNIKITYPDDLELANLILQSQQSH
ncbi:2-C-methyl-D-erythritol 4-phosphate cytidylyltransferase [Acinetobacter nematophilus]|uniref:2-C-methyl-D-erythritol 4-phosphate cytidylyltransferase n=1 Tax=Acinetobacter nematophilus TaxID=2994642 RepID=UPI003AF6EE55